MVTYMDYMVDAWECDKRWHREIYGSADEQMFIPEWDIAFNQNFMQLVSNEIKFKFGIFSIVILIYSCN